MMSESEPVVEPEQPKVKFNRKQRRKFIAITKTRKYFTSFTQRLHQYYKDKNKGVKDGV